MSTYLYLDTLNLNDQVNYSLGRGWRPRVARRRKSGMGGWLYEDVGESIPLRIFSKVSLDACLNARDAIVTRLDRAERWSNNEPVDAVLLKCKVDGSSRSTPLQSEVLEGDGDNLLELEADFNETVKAWEIRATLRLRRKGEWLDDEATVSPSGVAQPAVVTATFSDDIPLYSPLTLKASNIDYENQNGIVIPRGMWFVASQATRLKLLEGEARETSGTSTSTAAAVVDGNASGGNYLEFDSGEDGYWNLDTSDIVGDLIGVWAMCRQTVGSDIWQLTTDMYRQDTSGINLSQEVTIVDDGPSYEPVRLGFLSRADDSFTLHIQALRQSGSGKFNIDYLVLLALGAPSEQAIVFNAMTGILPYTGLPGDIVDRQMVIDSKRLDETRPRFRLEETSGGVLTTTISYEGHIHLASIGSTVCWLQMAGGGSGTWLWLDDGSTTRNLTAVRRRVYLAPR